MLYYPFSYHPYPYVTWQYRTYPPVNVNQFSSSVHSSRFLIQQAGILLDRFENTGFARKLMDEAQKGNQKEVDRLIRTMGLKIPVITRYTPSGVVFELHAPSAAGSVTCCILTFLMKWS